MDPERIHAYLQAACAGLGFDIGEVWLSSNQSGSTTLAKIEEKKSSQNSSSKSRSIRFLQLYTSKSYNSRRNDLLRPTAEDSEEEECSSNGHSSSEDLEKHVLSPLLVDAISKTCEVVWANCEEREGLLGRSDMRLQTAVGMPVAMDSDGNMCIVVMFSPRKLDNNDDAMEYLKFIGQSAVCTSIPCILPVLDTDQKKLIYNPKRFNDWQQPKEKVADQLGHNNHSSVKILSLDCNPISGTSLPSVPQSHELTSAPKDVYGIPKLPSFAELSNAEKELNNVAASPVDTSVFFDQTTYGVWSTIMGSSVEKNEAQEENQITSLSGLKSPPLPSTTTHSANNRQLQHEMSQLSHWPNNESREKPLLHPERKERLEEFAAAFLGMSVFDLADVWIPSFNINDKDTLYHVCSLTSTDSDDALNFFKYISRNTTLRQWSGAVGRAYSTGNPVWSTNQGADGIIDSERAEAFKKANIQTAFAVPIFSSTRTTPACVLCFYSTIRSDSVPFVLKFVQKALRMLWLGLEHIEPHSDVGKDVWSGVAPADLGEMAANTHLQKAFYRKRPIEDISSAVKTEDITEYSGLFPSHDRRNRSSSLTLQLQSLNMPSGQSSTPLEAKLPAIPTIAFNSDGVNFVDSAMKPSHHLQGDNESAKTVQNVIVSRSGNGPWTYPEQGSTTLSTVQDHIQQAVQSASDVFTNTTQYQHINGPAPKRAHTSHADQSEVQQSYQDLSYSCAPLHQDNQLPFQHQGYQNPSTSIPLTPEANCDTNSIFPSDTKEDPDVVRGYIEAFNALVHMNNIPNTTIPAETNTSIPPSLPTSIPSNQFIENNVSTSHTSSTANPFPDAMISSNLLCLPTATPVAPPSTTNTPKGKVCRIDGCNELSVTKRPYCVRHSGNRSCEHPGCTKCAQGATRFCIAHGGGRRCTFPGCDKGARDKFFCAAHGGGKRCTAQGCSKSAVGGSNLCTSHGGGRRCAVEGCNKSAQSSTKFCVKHGGGKKCAHNGCGKVARGRTLYCAAHGGGLRCKLEGCSRIAIGKMQLCRAHGGSSSRSKTRGAPTTVPFQYPPTLPSMPQNGTSTNPNAVQRF